MILLDTNVLSELMRPAPAGNVVRWIASQPVTGLYTTSVTQAEIFHGIMLLPAAGDAKHLKLPPKRCLIKTFTDASFPSTAMPHVRTPASPRNAVGRDVPFRISMHKSRRSLAQPGQTSRHAM